MGNSLFTIQLHIAIHFPLFISNFHNSLAGNSWFLISGNLRVCHGNWINMACRRAIPKKNMMGVSVSPCDIWASTTYNTQNGSLEDVWEFNGRFDGIPSGNFT
jgi:hypothetical protein